VTWKMNRRQFLATSGAALGSLVVVACGAGGGGGAAQPSSTGTVPPEARNRTRVVFWSAWGGKNGEALQTLVNKFNKSQSDIFVENQYQGTYEELAQKLATAMAAKQVPDLVVLSEVTWNKFYLNQTLEPLDDYFKQQQLDRDDYVDPLINEGTRQGKTWWVPFARSTPLFYYNRDLFKKAGLPDKAPETWDEVLEAAKELKASAGVKKPYAFTTAKNYNAWHFQGNEWQWGGNYSDKELNILIDKERSVEAGEWVRKFIHDEGLGYMAEDQSVDFANGICAMTQQSTGSLGEILETAKFEVGTAFLPRHEHFGCPTGGSGLSIIAAAPSDRKQAAFEFIKFLAQPENVVFWSQQSGYMPVTESARESSQMQEYFKQNPQFKVAVDQLPKTQPQDTARLFIPNGDQTIGEALEKIFVRNTPAEQAFKDAAQRLARDAEDVKQQIQEVGL